MPLRNSLREVASDVILRTVRDHKPEIGSTAETDLCYLIRYLGILEVVITKYGLYADVEAAMERKIAADGPLGVPNTGGEL